jgi:hypothetical protein
MGLRDEYNGLWTGIIATSLQLQSIITAQNKWLSKTRSIPHWTTSVFSSAVTDLVLIYESVTYESLRAKAERRLNAHSHESKSKSKLCYNRRSAGQSVLE